MNNKNSTKSKEFISENENNKNSTESISKNEDNLRTINELLSSLSKKNEENPLFPYLTENELKLLAEKLEELKTSTQPVKQVEVSVEKNVDKKPKEPISINVDTRAQKNTSNKYRENSSVSDVSDEKFLDIGEKQPVPDIDPGKKAKSALTEALEKSKANKNNEGKNGQGKKELQETRIEDKSQTGSQMEDKSQTDSQTGDKSQTTNGIEQKYQETILFESSSDGEILNKPSILPEVFPRDPIEVFPTNRPSVRRSEIKKPDPSTQEKGFDNPISQARKEAMSEDSLNSGSQAAPSVEQPEESVCTEIQVADSQNAVAIPQQQIGISPTHYTPHWSPRIIYGLPTFFILTIVLSKILTFDLSMKPHTKVRDRTRNDDKKEPEKFDNSRPSIFVFPYLLKGPVKLAQWLVATRDLPELDKRIKKSTISRIVAIIDEDRNGVILEILLSDFSTFTSINNHISSFVELSRLDEFLLIIELIIIKSEESFPARLLRDILLGTARDILPR